VAPMDPRLLRPRTRKPSATVPGAPTGLVGDNGSGLLWIAPASDGGLPITTYRVYADGLDVTAQGTLLLSPEDDFGWCLLGAACIPPGWYAGVFGLFTWEVSAVNAAGEGPRSESILYETF
jgi:hypothetical protein